MRKSQRSRTATRDVATVKRAQRSSRKPYKGSLENANTAEFKLPAPNECREQAGGQGSFETKANCEKGTETTVVNGISTRIHE